MSTAIESIAVEVGGMRFDVNRCGDASNEMILFLHGFPQTSYSWRHQLPWLAEKGYYCVAPNQRGYSAGARPNDVTDYATELLVRDMVGLMVACGHNKAHVVGHDWGGMIAWLLAALHPGQVRSLSVLSRPHPSAFRAAMASDAAQADRSRHHRTFQDPEAANVLLAENGKALRTSMSSQHVPEADIDAYL